MGEGAYDRAFSPILLKVYCYNDKLKWRNKDE